MKNKFFILAVVSIILFFSSVAYTYNPQDNPQNYLPISDDSLDPSNVILTFNPILTFNVAGRKIEIKIEIRIL
jgi:hypothetical protein